MMAYIQILAFVLCSCFLQDAFSVTRVRKVKTIQSNGPAEANGRVVRTTKVNRTVSNKVTETPTPSPLPVNKYPNLTAVNDMFWNTFENINRASENGKLDTRAARNLMENVLSNEQFWSTLVRAIRKRVDVTNDSRRADRKINRCNIVTSVITSPNAMQGFEDIANEIYSTMSNIRSEVSTDLGVEGLQLVTDMVNNGEVTLALDTITDIVTKVDCNPRNLIKGFEFLQKTLNMGGTIRMNGGLAKGLMSFTSNFN